LVETEKMAEIKGLEGTGTGRDRGLEGTDGEITTPDQKSNRSDAMVAVPSVAPKPRNPNESEPELLDCHLIESAALDGLDTYIQALKFAGIEAPEFPIQYIGYRPQVSAQMLDATAHARNYRSSLAKQNCQSHF